jgi:hypothetical protein
LSTHEPGLGSSYPIIIEADVWAERHRSLLEACFDEFSGQGEWPAIELLQHRFEVAGADIDVSQLGWQIPRPLA